MNALKKLFGGIHLTWPKLILLAAAAGAYTALMAILPAAANTSFSDISVSFEVWILFGIFIIMNSKSAKDSALKCFIFFLISQPLVYLIQVPFSSMGFGIFQYYKYWFIWTLLTIPMGFIGYYMKRDKWWGILILAPILLLLGFHYYSYFRETIYYFPFHLLSTAFCFITLLLYPFCIFNNKKIKQIGTAVSIVILLVMSIMALTHKIKYDTILLASGGSYEVTFDENCKVSLENDRLGKVYIGYNEGMEDYVVNGEFTKAGETNLILEDENGNKTVFDLTIGSNTLNLIKK